MCICNRSHNASDCKTVEIIIYKDQHTEYNGCNLCTDTGLYMPGCPFTESCWTTGLIHKCDENSKKYEEYQDTCIKAVRYLWKHTAFFIKEQCIKCKFKIKFWINKRTAYSTYKEWWIHFLCDKCKHNRYNRWKKSYPGCIRSRYIFLQCPHIYRIHNGVSDKYKNYN